MPKFFLEKNQGENIKVRKQKVCQPSSENGSFHISTCNKFSQDYLIRPICCNEHQLISVFSSSPARNLQVTVLRLLEFNELQTSYVPTNERC